MADGTKIEWTEATWNPITGCSIASPGCIHCYAMQLAGTRLAQHPSRAGLTIVTKNGPVWNGLVRFNEQWIDQPLKWKRPRMIFVCAHGDLFHEDVPEEWIDRVFAVMALCPHHTFQVLTKRADRMRRYLDNSDRMVEWRIHRALTAMLPERQAFVHNPSPFMDCQPGLPLPNVWLGVSCENQEWAAKRVPDLLATPAAVRWVSAEPLIGPIDFTEIDIDGHFTVDATGRYSAKEMWAAHWSPEATGEPLDRCIADYLDEFGSYPPSDKKERGIDWIVVGGESGPRARPMHPDWARSIRDQCAAAGVPFFFKQWGEYGPCEIEPPGSAILSVVTRRGRHLTGKDALWGDSSPDAEIIGRFGKRRAGRELDGLIHDGFPTIERPFS